MPRVPANDEGQALRRLQTLQEAGVHTGIWWYADHPTHYAGDAAAATADIGERLLVSLAQALASAVRLIKADDVTPRLQDEFYTASRAAGGNVGASGPSPPAD